MDWPRVFERLCHVELSRKYGLGELRRFALPTLPIDKLAAAAASVGCTDTLPSSLGNLLASS